MSYIINCSPSNSIIFSTFLANQIQFKWPIKLLISKLSVITNNKILKTVILVNSR